MHRGILCPTTTAASRKIISCFQLEENQCDCQAIYVDDSEWLNSVCMKYLTWYHQFQKTLSKSFLNQLERPRAFNNIMLQSCDKTDAIVDRKEGHGKFNVGPSFRHLQIQLVDLLIICELLVVANCRGRQLQQQPNSKDSMDKNDSSTTAIHCCKLQVHPCCGVEHVHQLAWCIMRAARGLLRTRIRQ